MLNITSQWQGPEILIFFCYKSIPRKIRSHAETPYAQVSLRSIRPFKEYRLITGLREAEADSSYVYRTVVMHRQNTHFLHSFYAYSLFCLSDN